MINNQNTNEPKTFSLEEIKSVLNNQLCAEKQMGAEERDFELLTNVFADLEHLFAGGWIVGGQRISI